jgi:hypothetical protein
MKNRLARSATFKLGPEDGRITPRLSIFIEDWPKGGRFDNFWDDRDPGQRGSWTDHA